MKKKLLAGLACGVMMLGMTGVASAATITIGASQDTWIWNQADYSHADSTELRANNTSSWLQNILMQFDVSSINSSIINSATINLYRYDGYTDTGILIDAHQVTSAWTEGATWSSQPGLNSSAIDTENITANGWYSWNVTSLAQQWVDGTANNYGVSFYDHGSSMFQRFYSSENGSLTPFLTVDYNAAAPVPEPATMILMGTGLAGLIGARRKKKK